MGEQQSRLRTQVWCQNTCQNCMSGAGDIDNSIAAQTELNRRNGTTNGVGTIIPREELQKLLKQQTLLPSTNQQKFKERAGMDNSGKEIKMVDSSLDMYGKVSGSQMSSKHLGDQATQQNQKRLQSYSSPKHNASGHQQNTNLATMGRKDSHENNSMQPSGRRASGSQPIDQQHLLVPSGGVTHSAGLSKKTSKQHQQQQPGMQANMQHYQSSNQQTFIPEEASTAQQRDRQQQHQQALHNQYLGQQPLNLNPSAGPYENTEYAQAKNSTLSSPPGRAVQQIAIGGGSAGGVSTKLQDDVMQAHQSQLREAQRVQRENRQSQKQLHLRVLSSAFLQKGQVITINEHGLASQEPLRRAYDGVTYFGCKRTLPKRQSKGQGEMEADSGAPAMVHESASEEDANSSAALDHAISNMKEIVNDFIIPACKKEDKEKHAGRQFQIRFDQHTDTYFIKDLQIGYGVFTETVGPVPLKDNLLINMGESYIVTNLGPPDTEIVQEYASNHLAAGQGEEISSQPPPKLKLRVFSVSKSDQPDLFCCQFEEQEVVIGRSPNCDIRVDDELLSKMQASINFELNSREWVLQDGYQGKRSTNGTWLYLNEEIPIQSGMLFKSNQTFFQATVE